jgi:hypothetical protein
MPTILSKNDVEIRNLRKQQLQEAIASEKARQDSYADGGGRGSGAMTQKELFDRVARINKAVAQLSVQPPQVDDPIKQYEMLTNRKELEGELGPTGLTIEQWNGMNDTQRQAAVFRAYSGGGAQGRGVVAPPQVGGGVSQGQAPSIQGGKPAVNPPSVASARMRFNAAASLSDGRKEAAIQALVDSGDKDVLAAMNSARSDPMFAGKQRNVSALYDYLKNKVKFTK